MLIRCTINDRNVEKEIDPDLVLADLLRGLGLFGVRTACDSSGCGLCTVWLDGMPVLSCSVLAARVQGREVTTIEGVQAEAREFAGFMAAQGADQCGYCSPGLIMSVLAMVRELTDPTDDDIRQYLAGNLCRCTGYESQMRAIRAFLQTRTAPDGKPAPQGPAPCRAQESTREGQAAGLADGPTLQDGHQGSGDLHSVGQAGIGRTP